MSNTSLIPVDKNIKALIFDIDGTLLDTMPIHFKACQIACSKYGFEFPLDFFYETAGTPTFEVFEMLGKKLNINANFKQIAIEKEEKYIELATDVKLIPAAEELIKRFEGILPMACGTGGTREIADINLKSSNTEHYFQSVITCDDITRPKPDPETFLKAAKALGVAPEYCQVFEDGDLGIKAAIDAGMVATDIRKYI